VEEQVAEQRAIVVRTVGREMRQGTAQVPVGGAVVRPAAGTPSAVRETFASHGSSAYGLLSHLHLRASAGVSTTTTEPYHCCGLVNALVELEKSSSVLSTPEGVCHKTRTPSAP